MKIGIKYSVVLITIFLGIGFVFAQDDSEENVLAEKYSEDQLKEEQKRLDFEESFIEAVSQRAMENYDKALELLSGGEKLYPENVAMLFEKAKNYFSLENYIESQNYCEKALKIEPENFWVKSLKRDVLLKQHNLPDALEIQKKLYAEKNSEAENLLRIYYLLQDKENGKKILTEADKNAIFLNNSKFYHNYFDQPETNSSSDSEENITEDTNQETKTSQNVKTDDAQLSDNLKRLEAEKNYKSLVDESQKAIELFPTNPLFYYYNGKSKNELKNYKEAVEVLENGLDFIFNDNEFLSKFYTELIVAYTALENNTKANAYKQLVQKLK